MSDTTANGIDALPDEILLQVFKQLVSMHPTQDEQPWHQRGQYAPAPPLPEPHPGLRSYPFLGQVCRRWHSLLQQPQAMRVLSRSIVLDFGHELFTSVHTPLRYSNENPSEEEFREQYGKIKLSASKMVGYVWQRRDSVRRLALLDGDGYWNEEREFVGLQHKHDFGPLQLGMLLGVLLPNLQALHLEHCNEMVGDGCGLWAAVGGLPQLTSLSVLHLAHRLSQEAAAKLSTLTQLQQLTIGARGAARMRAVGLDAIPLEWTRLSNLRALSLQHHAMLDELPAWLPPAMPRLRSLDLAHSSSLHLATVVPCGQLEALSLQGMHFTQRYRAGVPVPQDSRIQHLCDLSALSGLTSLILSDNLFTRVPEDAVSRLYRLVLLDLARNRHLQIPQPLQGLLSLPSLSVVDLRGIHEETGMAQWSEAKCVTMEHVSLLSRSLQCRPHPSQVLVDSK